MEPWSGDPEHEQWGHYSLPSEDDGDSEDDQVVEHESVRPVKNHDNRFASSHFGISCVCAIGRKPNCGTTNMCASVGLDKIASRKRLSDENDDSKPPSSSSSLSSNGGVSRSSATSLRSCGETSSLVDQNPEEEDDDDEQPDDLILKKLNEPKLLPEEETPEKSKRRRRKPSEDPVTVEEPQTPKGGLWIEARVRKRRDDFCGDGRGKSTAWDVERWNVYASGSSSPVCDPDHDDIVLTPAFAPRVATRFFAKRPGQKGMTVSFAMGSIRVVSTAFDRYAQYELVVRVDGRPPSSAWRRYSAFRALVSSVAAESAPRQIVRTLSAWADAQDAKRIFRCTHPAYLIQRYYHFEHVLREALFELEYPPLLLAFFAPDPDDTASSSSEVVVPVGGSSTTNDHDEAGSFLSTNRRWETTNGGTNRGKSRRRHRHHSTPPTLSEPIPCPQVRHQPIPTSTPSPGNPLLAALLGIKEVSRRSNDF